MIRILSKVICVDIESYENGNLKYMCTYVNGKIHNDYWFDENGKIRCMIVDNNPHGDEYRFYENGNLKHMCTYVNNKFHGDMWWFHANGKIDRMCTYINDVLQN